MSSVSAYTPVTKSGQITFSGLGNGTDFDQLITKLVQVEQTRITTLQTWKQSWTQKQTAFKELNTQLLALDTTLGKMDTEDEFLTKGTTTTDSNVLTVTTAGGADDGSHTVTVNRLATAKAMVTTSGFVSASAPITVTAGTFAYDYKGTTYTNDIGANSTLTDLCSIINNDASNPGVKASVVYDGTGYFLQMRGMDTGASATLTIDASTTLSGFSASDFSTVSSNCSAELKLDGWPTASNAWITRETNSVSNLLTGLTLNLKSTGRVTTTTTTDTAATKKTIQTFVEQMNTVRTMIQDLTAYDSTSEKGSVLTGNYGLQTIDSRLKTIVASIGVGFDRDSDTYCALSQLGIMTDAEEGSSTEGLLVISNAKLDAALASDPDAVAKLFSATYVGGSDTNDFTVSSYIAGTTKCGTYDISYTCDGSGTITAATIDGHAATIGTDGTITGKHPNDEAGMIIRCLDVSVGTHTGTASLKQGKTGELSDILGEMTDTNNGILNILQDNYTDITDMIDEKISYEQTRVANYASRLRKRFAKVDSLLSTYSQQQTSLTSFIDQLSSS